MRVEGRERRLWLKIGVGGLALGGFDWVRVEGWPARWEGEWVFERVQKAGVAVASEDGEDALGILAEDILLPAFGDLVQGEPEEHRREVDGVVDGELVLWREAVGLRVASHRPDQSYPVVIDPPAEDIPEFLERERYVPGTGFGVGKEMAAITRALQGRAGKYVTNEWVCSTPSEFEERLKTLFAKDSVKTRIISLLAPARMEEPGDKGVENREEEASGGKGEEER